KYSFPTAKKYMKEMDTILLTIEQKVENLLVEIQTLLKTEEDNRELMGTIEPQLQELRKFLSQNRYKFNKADVYFETTIFKKKKKYKKKMNTILLTIEKKVENLLVEIQTLLKTEEDNRELMGTIEPQLQELRKFLSQNRYKFNKADVRFETAMDKVKEAI